MFFLWVQCLLKSWQNHFRERNEGTENFWILKTWSAVIKSYLWHVQQSPVQHPSVLAPPTLRMLHMPSNFGRLVSNWTARHHQLVLHHPHWVLEEIQITLLNEVNWTEQHVPLNFSRAMTRFWRSYCSLPKESSATSMLSHRRPNSQRLHFGLGSQMAERHSCYWTITITSMPQQDFALLPSEKINILLVSVLWNFAVHRNGSTWKTAGSYRFEEIGLPPLVALSRRNGARLTRYE